MCCVPPGTSTQKQTSYIPAASCGAAVGPLPATAGSALHGICQTLTLRSAAAQQAPEPGQQADTGGTVLQLTQQIDCNMYEAPRNTTCCCATHQGVQLQTHTERAWPTGCLPPLLQANCLPSTLTTAPLTAPCRCAAVCSLMSGCPSPSCGCCAAMTPFFSASTDCVMVRTSRLTFSSISSFACSVSLPAVGTAHGTARHGTVVGSVSVYSVGTAIPWHNWVRLAAAASAERQVCPQHSCMLVRHTVPDTHAPDET